MILKKSIFATSYIVLHQLNKYELHIKAVLKK